MKKNKKAKVVTYLNSTTKKTILALFFAMLLVFSDVTYAVTSGKDSVLEKVQKILASVLSVRDDVKVIKKDLATVRREIENQQENPDLAYEMQSTEGISDELIEKERDDTVVFLGEKFVLNRMAGESHFFLCYYKSSQKFALPSCNEINQECRSGTGLNDCNRQNSCTSSTMPSTGYVCKNFGDQITKVRATPLKLGEHSFYDKTYKVVENQKPSISSIGRKEIEEDQNLRFRLDILDAETSLPEMKVEAFSSNKELVPDSNLSVETLSSGIFLNITPANNKHGTATITIEATDSGNEKLEGRRTVVRSFDLVVNSVFDNPVIFSVPDQYIYTDEEKVINLTLDYHEEEEIYFSAESTNDLLGELEVKKEAGRWNLIIKPNEVNLEGARVIIKALNKNNNELLAQTEFEVTVNQKPFIAEIEKKEIEEDQDLNFQLNITDKETPLSEMELEISSSNEELVPGSNISIETPGTGVFLNITPLENKHGTTNITVKATDSGNENSEGRRTATRTFDLVVNSVYDPPVLSPILDQYMYSDEEKIINLDIDYHEDENIQVTAESSSNLLEELEVTKEANQWKINIKPNEESLGKNTVTVKIYSAENEILSQAEFNVYVQSLANFKIFEIPISGENFSIMGEEDKEYFRKLGDIIGFFNGF